MSIGASTQAMVGAVLSSRYRLLRLLGEGAMGAVFEAQDLQGSSRCAIKMLHPEYSGDERILSRFFGEAEVSSRLVHPNIARSFGCARAEDHTPYLIMELIEGAPLASYLKPGLAYGPHHAVPIVRGLLAALGAAHRQGIVHRDVKPENVFLIPHPEGPPVVKLLDFGIARVMDAAGGMMTRTRAGMLLGTPSYMSPEQIRNSKDVGPRADLWSAAVILYQLLAGREPFAAPTELAKLTLILTSEAPPIDQSKSELSHWRGFFARALARNIEQRFATADEMEAAMSATAQVALAYAPGMTSTTDMSPEMPRGGARSGPPQIHVTPTPVPTPPPPQPTGPDRTLRTSDYPAVARESRVAMWVAVLVAATCLLAGFLLGFVVGRL